MKRKWLGLFNSHYTWSLLQYGGIYIKIIYTVDIDINLQKKIAG